MKLFSILSIIIISNFFFSSLYAGELEPPGLPQSTMKPLNLVEPRTALVPNGETISIDVPGSYYLTGNLTVQNASGIEINADRVTLDLNAFTVSGNAIDFNYGILAVNREAIVIKNGFINGFFNGIYLVNSSVVMIDHMQVNSAQQYGVLQNGDNTIITNSNFFNNGVDGVLVGNEKKHVIITNCRSVNNSDSGIDFINGGAVNNGMLIKNCVALNNGGNDIEIQNGLVVESTYETIIAEAMTTDIVDSHQVN